MDLNLIMGLSLFGMITAILLGVHIGLALGMTALVGTTLLFANIDTAVGLLGSAAYDVLRREIFATIPLFVLMGDIVARSGAAKDLYNVINRGLARIPGRLAVATVIGNAVFAAVTGVSIAAAAAFSRIAYPQMQRFGYKRTYALGSIAGSASLGMLIPPSILMIVWGIITETSVGLLFIAGIMPGILLALLFVAYAVIAAHRNPSLAPPVDNSAVGEIHGAAEVVSGLGILGLILLVLGGIWLGVFTSFEAAGIGALGSLLLAVIKGMRWRGIGDAIVDAGRTAAPIMILLLTAGMYSKFLALGGIIDVIRESLTTIGFGDRGTIVMMVVVWLVLGTILDSVSIIILTVPIFWPVAESIGFDPFAFAVFGILAIEAGLLTPPFGLLVYAVKGAIPDSSVSLGEIFKGSVPYWLLMLVAMLSVWAFPWLATGLHG